MNGMEVEMRPPYVVWEENQIEDRTASIEKGHYVAKRIDYALVTRPGQKDTLRKEAQTYINDCFRAAKEGRMPAAWPEHFKLSYERWLSGTSAAIDGTPIKGWPVLSAAQQNSIINAGVLSVEDLAQVPDSDLNRIGMGAVAYKQKAIAWLGAAKDVGKTAELVAAQTVQIEELKALTQSLQAQLQALNKTTAKA